MNKSTVVAIHKYSSKFILQPDVADADIIDFGNQAMEAFKKGLSDPDITTDQIVIIKLTPGSQVKESNQLDLIINPPQNRPVNIVTHSK